LPSEYIYDSVQKIEIYKKVAAASETEDIEELFDEMIDRFGEPPKAALNLLAVARLKVRARRLGIESIQRKGEEVVLKFAPQRAPEAHQARLKALEPAFRGQLQADAAGGQPVARLRCRGLDDDAVLALAEQFLIQYEEATKSKGELQDVAP
jgi:transcription-repair coupling factor (superfamily II helicase)